MVGMKLELVLCLVGLISVQINFGLIKFNLDLVQVELGKKLNDVEKD